MELQELQRIMQDGGIIGAGGAGFPSYAKLNPKVETVILNCAECEPLLKLHRQLLASRPAEIITALEAAAQAMQAKEIIIAVKGAYAEAVEAAEAVIAERSLDIPVRLGLLPEIYPAGDEVITIFETTGKVVPPGKIPLDVGVAVFNVETMYNTWRAMEEKKPVTHKYLTVAGEVKEPKTLCVPIGMTIGQAVALAGGVTTAEPAYIHGGPMTGPLAKSSDLITKTSNAVLVLPKGHPVIQKKLAKSSISMKRAMAACCQCQMCTDLCPRHLIGHPIEPHAFMRAATTGVTKDLKPFLNTYFCSQCSVCEMFACPQGLAPKSLIGDYKAGLRSRGVPMPAQTETGSVNPFREGRRVSMKRLLARLALNVYDLPAPVTGETVVTGEVHIRLNQHIGAPACAVVKPGDRVTEGQLIAQAADGKLSVPYHASLTGVVTEANGNVIIIKSGQ